MPRIVVVDDDIKIVRLVRAYLEQAGYHVLTAHDGNAAMLLIRQERPDLVVLDLMMPNRDGWDVTRIVRGERGPGRHAHFLFMRSFFGPDEPAWRRERAGLRRRRC